MQDSLAQLEKLSDLKQALQDEIIMLSQAGELAAGRWIMNRKKERLAQLSKTQKELEKDVLFTVAAERFKKFENDVLQPANVPISNETHRIIEKQLNARTYTFQQNL